MSKMEKEESMQVLATRAASDDVRAFIQEYFDA
jgi:hypothetical protein